MEFITRNNKTFQIINFLKTGTYEIQNAHIAKIVSAQNFKLNNVDYIISTSHDKSIKIWKNDQLINSISIPKKIMNCIINDQVAYVFDKFGDIFKLNLQNIDQKLECTHVSGNLATFTCYLKAVFKQKSYLIACDEYSRIKVFDLNNVQRIITIWIPYKDFTVKNIIQTNNSLIFVFQNQNDFKIVSLPESQIENEQFNGKVLISYQNLKKVKNFEINDQYMGQVSIDENINFNLYKFQNEQQDQIELIKNIQIDFQEKLRVLKMDEKKIYIQSDDNKLIKNAKILYSHNQQIIQIIDW